jgi:hypothetical protein
LRPVGRGRKGKNELKSVNSCRKGDLLHASRYDIQYSARVDTTREEMEVYH